MPTIQTPRLHLVALDHKQLKHYSDAPVRLLQEFELKVTLPEVSTSFNAEMDHAMRTRWLPDTLAYPDLYPWYTNWLIVHKQDKIIVGTIGLGGYPNDQGETTIGYMIGEQYRGKGYATEALNGMISWAFAFSALQVIKADTNISNLASQRVLVKAGFVYTHTDEYDKHYQLTRRQATQHTIGS